MSRIFTAAALVALASGCGGGRHLQYDHGRAVTQAMQTQADRTRPSVANAAYALDGRAGLEVRERVVEQSTDAETGTPDAVKTISVE